MATKYINCYGFERSQYGRGYETQEPYQLDRNGDVYYVRFDNKNPTAIQRCTKSGDLLTQEWAYGDWASRASLTYVPINQLIEVEA